MSRRSTIKIKAGADALPVGFGGADSAAIFRGDLESAKITPNIPPAED